VTEDELLQQVESILDPTGMRIEDGEEFREPPLDVVRYHVRVAKLGRLPVLDRVRSVVAIVRQPADMTFAADGLRSLMERVARAAHTRFPPWPRGEGLTLALTTLVLTPEPIRPDESPRLGELLAGPRRGRVVPLAVVRLNLGQGAVSLALTGGLENRFPEVPKLADALEEHFGRFLTPFSG
jgi:hypothetical protein